jgi:hypothetical protein
VGADEILAAALAKATPRGTDPGPEEPPKNPVSRRGEVYELGPHRLMCGDSTDAEDVRHLVGDARATLMATDPPYLVDYDAGNHPQSFSSKGRKTQNKTWDAYKDPEIGVAFFSKFLRAAIEEALGEGFAVYQWHASRRGDLVMRAWEENELLTHQSIVWVKERPVLTRSHFMWQCEPCWYGWRKGSPPKRRPPTNQPNVWRISQKGQQQGFHPTQKSAPGCEKRPDTHDSGRSATRRRPLAQEGLKRRKGPRRPGVPSPQEPAAWTLERHLRSVSPYAATTFSG